MEKPVARWFGIHPPSSLGHRRVNSPAVNENSEFLLPVETSRKERECETKVRQSSGFYDVYKNSANLIKFFVSLILIVNGNMVPLKLKLDRPSKKSDNFVTFWLKNIGRSIII